MEPYAAGKDVGAAQLDRLQSGIARRIATAVALAAIAMATAGVAGSARVVLAGDGRHFAGGSLPAAPTVSLRGGNRDIEPGIAVTPDGVFWIAATINADPRSGTGGAIPPQQDPEFGLSGTDIWRSVDGGASYQWVAAPFDPVPDRPGLGGADSDIAVATQRNASGHFNVYAASLWQLANVGGVGVGDISVAVSQDAGKSWFTDVVAADVPLDDRPWLAADGACTLYMAYHAGPAVTTVVDRFDLCNPVRNAMGQTLVPVASTRLPATLVPAATGQPGTYVLGIFSKPAVDTSQRSRFGHTIYVPVMDCPGLTLAQEAQRAVSGHDCPSGHAEVYLFRSSDQGSTWSLIPVAASTSRFLGTWLVWAATDSAGTVYIAWSDTRNVYLDISHDGGSTWSSPRLVNRPPSPVAVLPTLAASSDGIVEIAWYGSPVAGASDDATAFGVPGALHSVPWSVFSARSTDGGVHFDQVQATGTVHTGKVCANGGACNLFSGERDLFDDFGVAISPTTGRSSIAYTSDQPQGDLFHDFTGYATQSSAQEGVSASSPAAGSAALARLPNTGSSRAAVTGLVSVVALMCTWTVRRSRRWSTRKPRRSVRPLRDPGLGDCPDGASALTRNCCSGSMPAIEID